MWVSGWLNKTQPDKPKLIPTQDSGNVFADLLKFLCGISGLKSEKVQLVACGRNHTLICTGQNLKISPLWIHFHMSSFCSFACSSGKSVRQRREQRGSAGPRRLRGEDGFPESQFLWFTRSNQNARCGFKHLRCSNRWRQCCPWWPGSVVWFISKSKWCESAFKRFRTW